MTELFFQALFRIVDITNGSISIDNRSIYRVSKKTLRSKLSIIPQQPFLFNGTIRENLDPLQTKSDAQIWEAARNCRLEDTIQRFGGMKC